MSILRKVFIGAGVVTASLSVATLEADAFERRGKDKILVVAARQKVPTMDPGIKYDASIRTIQNGVYDALAKYVGSPPKVVPWLASKWDVSADNKTYTFHLVKNAKFQNN